MLQIESPGENGYNSMKDALSGSQLAKMENYISEYVTDIKFLG